MKLTQKTVKQEVETTETVCEITRDEFENLCAKVSANTVIKTIGDDPEIDDMLAGLALTRIFANLCASLEVELFGDTNENPDKKEKEEK